MPMYNMTWSSWIHEMVILAILTRDTHTRPLSEEDRLSFMESFSVAFGASKVHRGSNPEYNQLAAPYCAISNRHLLPGKRESPR